MNLAPRHTQLLDEVRAHGPQTIETLAERFGVTLQTVRRELNPSLVLTGLLVTMADERTRLAKDVEAELREHFPDLVLDTVVPRSVRIAEAPSFVFVCDSKTGSCTRTETAATIDWRMSGAS